jgi:hypothetical protein
VNTLANSSAVTVSLIPVGCSSVRTFYPAGQREGSGTRAIRGTVNCEQPANPWQAELPETIRLPPFMALAFRCLELHGLTALLLHWQALDTSFEIR